MATVKDSGILTESKQHPKGGFESDDWGIDIPAMGIARLGRVHLHSEFSKLVNNI